MGGSTSRRGEGQRVGTTGGDTLRGGGILAPRAPCAHLLSANGLTHRRPLICPNIISRAVPKSKKTETRWRPWVIDSGWM